MTTLIAIFLLSAAVASVVVWRIARRRRSETATRRWFDVSFGLIVVPYATAILGLAIGALVLAVYDGGWGALAWVVPLSAGMSLPIICGLVLSLGYLSGGVEGLMKRHRAWWWGACIGAAVPAIGLVALALTPWAGDLPIEPVAADPSRQPFGPARIREAALASLVAPLLVPLWLLLRERANALRSNNSLERSRDP